MSTVSLIEADEEYCRKLRTAINATADFLCKSFYTSCDTAIKNLPAEDPDLILMDVKMPCGIQGISAIAILKRKIPSVNIIALTDQQDEESILHSISCGAVGYILKHSTISQILDAMRITLNGGAWMNPAVALKLIETFQSRPQVNPLTDRERQILYFVWLEYSDAEISDMLHIEPCTLKYHYKNIYIKLHVRNKTQAVIRALKLKLFY